jgi:hypothetical protein
LRTVAPSSGFDEPRRRVGRVLELSASAERDFVPLAARGGDHRERRSGGHPVVAPRAIDDVRPQAHAGDPVVSPVDPRGPLVGLLVNAVVIDRMTVGVLGHEHAVGPVVDRGRARIRQPLEPPALDRIEHVDGADDVDERATRGVGSR